MIARRIRMEKTMARTRIASTPPQPAIMASCVASWARRCAVRILSSRDETTASAASLARWVCASARSCAARADLPAV